MNKHNEEKKSVVDEVFEDGELSAQERAAMELLVGRLEALGEADAVEEGRTSRVLSPVACVEEDEVSPGVRRPASSVQEVDVKTVEEVKSAGLIGIGPMAKGWLRRWAVPAGLAAALLVGVGIGYQGRGLGLAEPVAWAQVVEAFEKTPSFHATMVIERTNAIEIEDRMMRAELYYKSPGKWRAMIPGFVEFNKGGNKAGQVGFDTKEKTRAEGDKKGAGRLLPKLLSRWNKKRDMLEGLVAVIFMLPADAPMPRVERVGSSGGVEVFDYVVDARQKWARVWVMKESRLPIQIKVFDPSSNGLILMTFDYDDPQPDAFFDADAFEKALKVTWAQEPARARIGMVATGGKPTASEQIVKRVEDLVTPKLVGIYGDVEGRIMAENTNTNNRAMFANMINSEGMGVLGDNWGNTYLWTNTFEMTAGTTKTFYVPQGTFKKGTGERVVSYEYRVSGDVPEKGTQRPAKFSKVLLSGSLAAGFELPKTLSAADAKRGWNEEDIRRAQESRFKETAPPSEQWKRVQEKLRVNPESEADLYWAYMLLRDYGRQKEAREMVNKVFLPRFLKNPEQWMSFDLVVSAELGRMFKEGGLAAVMPAIQAIEGHLARVPELPAKGKAWTQADFDNQAKWDRFKRVFNKENGSMAWLLELPEGVRKFEASPKPEVVELLRDAQGGVVVKVKVPPVLVKNVSPSAGWRTSPRREGGEQEISRWDQDAYVMLLDARKEVVVHFDVAIVGRNIHGSDPGTMGWDLRVDLAKAKDVASVKAWWEEKYPAPAGQAVKYTQEQKEASDLYSAMTQTYEGKEYAKTAALGRGLAAIRKDLWANDPWTESVALGRPTWHQVRSDAAWCLWWKARIELGEAAEVLKEVEAKEAGLPMPRGEQDSADLGIFEPTWWRRGELLEVKLTLVRRLMREGKLAQARAVMDEIQKAKPDFDRMPDAYVEVVAQGSRSMFWPRSFVKERWAGAGAAEWDLADAMEEKK